jgi:hypothetical protein
MQGRVHLFPSIYQAEHAATKPCGSVACKMAHTVEAIQPDYPPQPVSGGNIAALMAED